MKQHLLDDIREWCRYERKKPSAWARGVLLAEWERIWREAAAEREKQQLSNGDTMKGERNERM
jgi:hypothetical protein